jgi:hypothetical protein
MAGEFGKDKLNVRPDDEPPGVIGLPGAELRRVPQGRPETRPEADPRINPGADRQADRTSVPLNIAKGTLELSINDADFDKKLAIAAQTRSRDFNTLKIDDIPDNVRVNYWQDPKGLFVWFDGGTDHNKKHYLPANLTTLELPREKTLIEDLRVNVNKRYAERSFSGLESFGPNYNPTRDGGYNAMSYYMRMSNIASETLDRQEEMLRKAVATSSNPYYKIYLADTLTAQAMKPVADAMIHHHTVDVRNVDTMKKLQEAMSVLDAAAIDSRQNLAQGNRFPKGYDYTPPAPGRPYWNLERYPQDYYGFWGGSFDQAMARQANLKLIYGMINTSNAIPRFELPPNLPPR